jgi:hypothetical protein
MPNGLMAVLQTEERQLVTELRATPTFRKLDAIRRLITLYGPGSSVVGDAGVAASASLPAAMPPPANGSEPPHVRVVENQGSLTAAATVPAREANKAVSVVRAALAAVTG